MGQCLRAARVHGPPTAPPTRAHPPALLQSRPPVEPGCYFNAVLLEPAFKDPQLSQFLVESELRQFMVGVGRWLGVSVQGG